MCASALKHFPVLNFKAITLKKVFVACLNLHSANFAVILFSYVHFSVCVYIYTHAYIYIFTDIHIHIYIYMTKFTLTKKISETTKKPFQ